MKNPYCSRFLLNSIISRSLLVGILATLGLLGGLAPVLSNRSQSIVFSSAAYAQDIGNEELNKYALSLLAIEPLRQEAYNEIKKLLGSGSVPPIVCNDPNSLGKLPAQYRAIAVNYCEKSKGIVESNGLSINRFNEITLAVESDLELQKRLTEELIRIQQPSASQ